MTLVKRNFHFFFNILREKVFSNALYVTIAVFISSIINYFFQIVLARILTIDDYGTFTALLSLSYILLVPINSIIFALIKYVTNLNTQGLNGQISYTYRHITKVSFILTVVSIFILYLLMELFLRSYLNIDSTEPAVYFFITFLSFSFISIAPNAFLQGLIKFKLYAITLISGGLFRLVLGAIIFGLWLGLKGVFIGMTLAIISNYVFSTYLLKSSFTKAQRINKKDLYKSLFSIGIPVILTRICMSVLNNQDVIFVKHYFDPTTSGVYAGVVTTGKVFLFGAGILITVMYPIISDEYSKNSSYFSTFVVFLLLQIGLILGGLFVFFVFPDLLISVMFGKNFLPSATYMPMFSVFTSFYLLINMFIMFLIAIEKFFGVLLLVGFVLLQLVLLNVYNDSLNQIINVNILVSLCLTITLMMYIMYVYGKTKYSSPNV